MKLEQILRNYLVEIPQARERHNKVRAISNLLQKTHPAIRNISKEVMIEIVDEVISYERYWRKILQDTPELRGNDYDSKRKVVQTKIMELGYESGFDEINGKLETL